MATTYATTNEVTTYLQLALSTADAATENEVKQAEIDLDDYALGFIGSWDATTERKLKPANYTSRTQTSLKRAVAIQVDYRRVMSASFFTRAQLETVESDGFKRTGTLPLVAPKASLLLAEAGLVRRTGRISNWRRHPIDWFETAADEE
jgi:hypothetical protein